MNFILIEFYNRYFHLEYDYNNNINLSEVEKIVLELEEYKNIMNIKC